MIIEETQSVALAKSLLDTSAVSLRPNAPCTWASGLTSPIYCDNRLTLRYPELRTSISKRFSDFITQKFGDTDVITGTATAGIPHAAWVAQNLNKPMAYIRARAKSYGLGNQLEGGVDKGQSTIIIEELISTGGSALSVAGALEFVGANVQAMRSIFTYGFERCSRMLKAKTLPRVPLTNDTALLDVSLEEGDVQPDDMEQLSSRRETPATWAI